jgi:hypothetical protein
MLDRREFLGLGLAAAPAVLGARLAWSPTRPRAVAFVTADTEAQVVVVGLAGGGRVLRRIRTLEDPRSIERGPGGRDAIVGHAGEGAITLLDLAERRVRRVLRGFGTPRYTAFAPGGRLAYVSDGGTGEIAVIDVRAGRVRRRVDAGDGARHLTLSPDGRTLWVALGSSAAEIAVLDVSDPERPRRVATIRPSFLAHDVGFSPSGRRVWITAGRVPRVAIFDARSRRPVRTLSADPAPQHVTFGAAAAYLASGNAARLAVHALTDGHRLHHTHIPIGSYNIQHTAARTITPSLSSGALTVVAPNGRTLASVHAADHAHDACLG